MIYKRPTEADYARAYQETDEADLAMTCVYFELFPIMDEIKLILMAEETILNVDVGNLRTVWIKGTAVTEWLRFKAKWEAEDG